MSGAVPHHVRQFTPTAHADITRPLPVEAAVAIEINGLGYAVMMATPTDLEDFATGFLLAERLVDAASDIHEVSTQETPLGWRLMARIDRRLTDALVDRVRVRLSEGSCGLCGLETLEQIARPLPPITATLDVPSASIFTALASLRPHQPLNATTGGVHAAAFCGPDGRIRLVREDVGRHNALDKLIGALARAGILPSTGFILVTARCSYELVEKTVIAGCPLLVSISTATTLAARRAAAAGLRLVALARPDSALEIGAEAGA
ncbi:formate dehydrogenase accessory sulfurtransferase FdhD [Polymorphobacter sp.]|uniref:formate dehydrogenase accessory sulfurtransferase FdhD n=1 Tax=Polymorphobacter sp. TaxID=1909290 RepID=UPI003F7109A0